MSYRAFDPQYANMYPPGDIGIGIYTRDADTLAAWVDKHTGPPGSSDHTRYWSPVTNEVASTAGGRQAVSFDWVPDTGPPTIHDTAVFLGTSYMLTVGWWSTVPSYATTLQPYYQRMLLDLQV
ncbi:MAG: hypothetical protein ACREOM_12735 [Candidatus Dormibacteraceae bacterium]